MKTMSITLSLALLSSASLASAALSNRQDIRDPARTDAGNGAIERLFSPHARMAGNAVSKEPVLMAGNTACNPRVKVCEE